ncbi:MAG: AIPR family protein [Phycisphaerales bacterium]
MAHNSAAALARATKSLTFSIPVDEYRSIPIPGFANAKLGTCYVRVTDLPDSLSEFMRVNPRIPNTTDKGRLSGPVPKAILQTLRESPTEMAIKNAGIYFLVASAEQSKSKGGVGMLSVELDDAEHHGIVNGGHTYAAIQQAIADADEEEMVGLRSAYVRLHFLKGVPEDKVVEIAEGLNRSKQVQIPSLENLKGSFDIIKKALEGLPGSDQIAYREGDPGDVYIGELISFIEMFNLDRYNHGVQPHDLYGRQYKAIAEFSEDLDNNNRAIELVVAHLAEILVLADRIRQEAPIVAKSQEVDFQIGRMKLRANGSSRVASPEHQNTPLHFLGSKTNYRLPNAWLFPMLAAFRANVEWDSKKRIFRWRVPNDELLRECLTKLVTVCVAKHREERDKPEWVGKKSSTYEQCGLYIRLYLAERPRK